MEDCKLSPRPQAYVKVVCAGQSPRGIEFGAAYGDYNFVAAKGVNTPTAHAATNAAMAEAAARTGRDVGNYVLLMVIADETDEAAMAKWRHYNEGADLDAMTWLADQANADTNAAATSTARQMAAPDGRGQLQHGHPGRLLRQRRPHARRIRQQCPPPKASCSPSTTS